MHLCTSLLETVASVILSVIYQFSTVSQTILTVTHILQLSIISSKKWPKMTMEKKKKIFSSNGTNLGKKHVLVTSYTANSRSICI